MKLLIFVLPPEYDRLFVGVWCFAAVVVCLFVGVFNFFPSLIRRLSVLCFWDT